jgi:hypothetical protein
MVPPGYFRLSTTATERDHIQTYGNNDHWEDKSLHSLHLNS